MVQYILLRQYNPVKTVCFDNSLMNHHHHHKILLLCSKLQILISLVIENLPCLPHVTGWRIGI